jgi:hypothetical protein
MGYIQCLTLTQQAPPNNFHMRKEADLVPETSVVQHKTIYEFQELSTVTLSKNSQDTPSSASQYAPANC